MFRLIAHARRSLSGSPGMGLALAAAIAVGSLTAIGVVAAAGGGRAKLRATVTTTAAGTVINRRIDDAHGLVFDVESPTDERDRLSGLP